ncbi:MAG: GtrA family protein [Bacteroidaceae bacterium]|nr:GtrA family protein [Bacteroidaceae bacterium]
MSFIIKASHKIAYTLGIHNKLLKQAIKYLFVGGICTVLDFATLFILAEFFNINYIVASSISFLCGVILNYFICTYWVFDVHVVKKKRYEFLLYLFISIIGLAVNTVAIWALTEYLGIYFMLSKLLATGFTYFWNFFARKYLLHN